MQRSGQVKSPRAVATVREPLVPEHAGGQMISDKVAPHAKYGTFQVTEVALPRELLLAIPDRIQQFGVPPPRVRQG